LARLEDLGRSPSTLYDYRKYVDPALVPAIAIAYSMLSVSTQVGSPEQ